MISRRISCKPQNDNYRRLADYIADAKHKGEKTLMSWCAGCWAGEDYELAIQEVLDTQDLNQRTRKEKTYHLIVSFRPEDESVLTEKDFKEIEQEFSKALGFEEHQRHCGVHKNTNNIHMHIAYNMIHPEKLTRYEPYRDFYKRDRLHRELEQKFALKFDNGRKKDQEPKRSNDRAATYEAHSGQQSFDSYVKERKDFILKALDKAQNWQEFHKSLAQIGIEVRLRGNGCSIKDRHSQMGIKASRLDRDFTKSKLEAKLGMYRKPMAFEVQEKERYVSRPLHKHRGELYAEYRAAISGRKKAYEELRTEQDGRRSQTNSYWDGKIKRLRNDRKLRPKDRSQLIALASGRKIEAIESLKREMSEKRAELRTQTPFSRWNDFLKWKAENGDEIALKVLRSKKEPIQSNPSPAFDFPASKVSELKLKQSQFRTDSSLAWKDKRRLLSISKMLQLQAEEAKRTEDPRKRNLDQMIWRVDSSGNVLYTLKNGSMVKDNGDKIFFSVNDPGAAQVAQRFARMMFGRSVKVSGNEIGRRARRVLRG
ncbi:TraI/MobA(P) family conjugative relaxase [Maridesulfovibrio zosterae]|uniref:TraI/MobA(P) family conjugative relaxase n=1 Tax=Maridesulfovibrio zosterae TaxID=82171 RepID=UPI000410B47C|nr:TraI/MobA(P) family conjugative relaxase [Maridesulfovibrio zosterae]